MGWHILVPLNRKTVAAMFARSIPADFSQLRGKAARVCLVAVLHLGLAIALFASATPYRSIVIPEKPVDVALLQGPHALNLLPCPCTSGIGTGLLAPAIVGHRLTRSRRNGSPRIDEPNFICAFQPPAKCLPWNSEVHDSIPCRLLM